MFSSVNSSAHNRGVSACIFVVDTVHPASIDGRCVRWGFWPMCLRKMEASAGQTAQTAMCIRDICCEYFRKTGLLIMNF